METNTKLQNEDDNTETKKGTIVYPNINNDDYNWHDGDLYDFDNGSEYYGYPGDDRN